MKNPTLLALVVAIIGIMILPITQTSKIVLIFVAFGVVLFIKRGYILVALGSRALNNRSGNQEKAWHYYTQAWKAGLPANYTIMLGNLFVQRGDASVALEIYDSVIDREQKKRQPNQETVVSARISRTMALWALGKRSEAIEDLRALYNEGRRDKTLLINYGTYLLDEDLLDEAGDLFENNEEHLSESPGMTDNYGHYLFKTGAFLEAKQEFDKLLSDHSPKFPEAYVHAAQVFIALGKFHGAYALLEQALEKEFFQTATVSKESIGQMMVDLKHNPGFSSEEEISDELTLTLYEHDLFDDSFPNTDIDDDDEIEPNIELDPEDYDDEEDPEVVVDPDDISELEAQFFDDEYEDGDDEDKK